MEKELSSQQDKAVELLLPRIQILSLWYEYPNGLRVSDILAWDESKKAFTIGEIEIKEEVLKEYPTRFKYLKWYEYRSVSDFGNVKHCRRNDGTVFIMCAENEKIPFAEYTPITENEYKIAR
jgi:hypothetical protein